MHLVDSHRCFTPREAVRILARAVELDPEAPSVEAGVLEEAARRLGVSDAGLRDAVAPVDSEGERRLSAAFQPRARLRIDYMAAQPLPADRLPRIADEARRAFGPTAKVSCGPGGMAVRDAWAYGATTLTIRALPAETRMSLVAERSRSAAFLVGLSPLAGAGLFELGARLGGQPPSGAALPLAGALLMLLIAWTSWRRFLDGWRDSLVAAGRDVWDAVLRASGADRSAAG